MPSTRTSKQLNGRLVNKMLRGTWARMAGGAWRRGAARARTLRTLLRDTARALQDVQDILPVDPEVLSVVQEITNDTARPTALVILGTSPSARARLLNCLLGKKLLPESLPRGSKWLRIQYGVSTQVHLTVGNSEFELVEELECNQKPWDTLPLQDLLRQSHTDLGTTLEVELNTSLLKDGLRIIVPPDMNTEPGSSDYTTLKQIHNDLYHKRAAILKTYTPIFVYALDKFGRNIFNDNVSKMCVSRGEDDFWSTFNQNYMTKDSNGEKGQETTQQVLEEMWTESSSVFNFENFLDLHQIKEIDSNAQVFFCLFSNSRAEEKRRNPLSDATESTESALYNTEELPESDQGIFKDEEFRQTEQSPQSSKPNRRLQEEQIAFMNELLDQWELISHPPQKHNVKSQWAILDDVEIFKNLDNSEAEHGKRKKEIDSDRTQKTRGSLLNHVMRFAAESSQACLLHQCTRLSEVHGSVLQRCVLASFELARELQVVPAKVQFVARHEQQLYETIYEKFSEGDKKQELLQIMQEVLQEMRSEINNMDWSVDDLPCHQDKRYAMSNSIFYSSRSSPSISLQLSNPDRIGNGADRPERVDSPEPEDESDVEEAVSYESYNFDDFEVIHSNDESLCMSDVFGRQRSKPDSPTSLVTPIPIENEMELYSLSNAWRSVSVTTHSSVCTSSNISSKQASLDVQRTVLSKLSRKISLKMVKFVDCLKDSYFGTLQRLRIAGGEEESACCVLSPAWRRSAALQTAQELTPQRLARLISVQILERLSEAHERYQSALTSLESALASRLHHTEDIKLAIRKKYAPSFAQLCLESTSMCDLLMYGAPELGREIGRGQYGVVYAVRGAWAGHNPACVKSVFPADDRHYRELAMEFYYTRSRGRLGPSSQVSGLRKFDPWATSPGPAPNIFATMRVRE
ncbi:jg15519 [Pararge aegeria aegeria]|uniref:Jg15519 protein n=1 Tax=Pararge aegeria aegeria TaxID=348720 RepID=A0A8S4SB09_9NEOP|nr:jg15519 [Pararge aegeria aegeria]